MREHGGGTIAVSSQSSAASSIIRHGASVAGIGGFSGRESDVSASWLAAEVSSGKIRWVLVEKSAAGSGGGGGFGARMPGDSRTGARTAMAAAAKVCTKATLSTNASGTAGTLYDCQGHAAALASAGTTAGAQESRS